MIDFTEIGDSGETWEQFARDFLTELGFSVESPPDRGADFGKDMLLLEHLKGRLDSYPIRWLVSCKNFAKSNPAVAEADELNILERVESLQADGFLGFYATIPSATLNSRLRALRDTRKIIDYKFFDSKMIENYCIRAGYSKLLFRYFPNSYVRIAPIRHVFSEYLPLPCDYCGKDLLEDLFADTPPGIVAHLESTDESGSDLVENSYCACKGSCDEKLDPRFSSGSRLITTWDDIEDLGIPAWFLRRIFATMTQLNSGTLRFSPKALEKEKQFLAAIAQRAMRDSSEAELHRVATLVTISKLFGAA